MFGILNINKPAGWTSRDAVNRVQKLVRPHKVGHAGTLDPLATGVLVVCIGPATRLISYVQQMKKQYRATFLLGRSSASDDTDTDVSEALDAPIPSREQLHAALPAFLGVLDQVPPAFSAVKIAGQRAYTLARRGQEVDIAPRSVAIYGIEVLAYAYPELELLISCGSGTYIRSLGRDLAAALGTKAVMSQLVRTSIGIFQLEQALAIENLTRDQLDTALQSPVTAVDRLPKLRLTADHIEQLRFGRLIPSDINSECAGIDAQGTLIAILKPAESGMLRPHINFASST